ncbi:MAG: alpha/beta hydrolase [Acidimicrobiales bacterium]
MPQVEANGITIEYESTGEGEPLLLIMGLAGQLTDWSDDFVGEFVQRGFRVIRHDNRDAGLSTEFDWPTPPERQSPEPCCDASPSQPATPSTTWPPTPPGCSMRSTSTPPTSSACRWAG